MFHIHLRSSIHIVPWKKLLKYASLVLCTEMLAISLVNTFMREAWKSIEPIVVMESVISSTFCQLSLIMKRTKHLDS